MLRLPRTSLGMLLLILVIIAIVAELITRPTTRPPLSFVGRWEGERRTLEIDSGGQVTYWSRAGAVHSETGGHLMRLTSDTLSYRVFFVPTHLRVDSAPAEDSLGWALWIEGERLRKAD